MNSWETIHRKTVYEAGPVKLDEVQALDPNGNQKTRVLMSVGGDTSLVVPELDNGNYLVASQYRVGLESPTLEFPNGGIETGETPEQAAHRELREETGAEGKMTFLGAFRPLAGLVDLNVYVFHCKVHNRAAAQLEDYEDISIEELSLDEINKKIKEGEGGDAYMLSALKLLDMYQF